jgi:protein-tyrosine phosphatase
MRLPNGGRLVIEGHEYARETAVVEKFQLWVACAMEYTPLYYALQNRLTVWCPLDDRSPPRRGDVERALAASVLVADQLQHGKHVLVTCALGLNRSSFVAGLALRRMGVSGAKAVQLIQQARGELALSNQSFLELVLTG